MRKVTVYVIFLSLFVSAILGIRLKKRVDLSTLTWLKYDSDTQKLVLSKDSNKELTQFNTEKRGGNRICLYIEDSLGLKEYVHPDANGLGGELKTECDEIWGEFTIEIVNGDWKLKDIYGNSYYFVQGSHDQKITAEHEDDLNTENTGESVSKNDETLDLDDDSENDNPATNADDQGIQSDNEDKNDDESEDNDELKEEDKSEDNSEDDHEDESKNDDKSEEKDEDSEDEDKNESEEESDDKDKNKEENDLENENSEESQLDDKSGEISQEEESKDSNAENKAEDDDNKNKEDNKNEKKSDENEDEESVDDEKTGDNLDEIQKKLAEIKEKLNESKDKNKDKTEDSKEAESEDEPVKTDKNEDNKPTEKTDEKTNESVSSTSEDTENKSDKIETKTESVVKKEEKKAQKKLISKPLTMNLYEYSDSVDFWYYSDDTNPNVPSRETHSGNTYKYLRPAFQTALFEEADGLVTLYTYFNGKHYYSTLPLKQANIPNGVKGAAQKAGDLGYIFSEDVEGTKPLRKIFTDSEILTLEQDDKVLKKRYGNFEDQGIVGYAWENE